ncbi:DUF4349 domain-containing protein [Demequina muriae]|uniref:DUF4349 domain-containing protein n=1 Tax=Demequina muriae TaxID=3051664 RepID=A0ABT8GH89_9MICO|nr:DUF4349 domain-containing protein [Demequina sp. EGI L300058]MDN4480729.1 DUF4349 domain-containing protein [Demequina sp. EGI L300058]
MTDKVDGTVGRMRRTGIIVGLIVAAAALAGCSSSDEAFDSEGSGAADAGGGAVQEEAGADVGTETVADDRSLIVTGSLYMTVEDPIAAADQAVGMVQSAGGRVDARNETAADEYDGGSASLLLRIPQDRLDAVVDDLRALGTVDQFATESRDVTTEVTDLDARISTLRASTDRIQGLLLEAEDIKDIIALEDELAGRQAELESLESRQRGLDDQVSMSTIELSLTTEPIVIVDDSPESFWDGLQSGWNALVSFFSVVMVLAGVLLPWAALAAVLVVATVVGIRARRSRTSRQATGPGPAPAAPSASPEPPPAPTH